jgi:hypothetical protein
MQAHFCKYWLASLVVNCHLQLYTNYDQTTAVVPQCMYCYGLNCASCHKSCRSCLALTLLTGAGAARDTNALVLQTRTGCHSCQCCAQIQMPVASPVCVQCLGKGLLHRNASKTWSRLSEPVTGSNCTTRAVPNSHTLTKNTECFARCLAPAVLHTLQPLLIKPIRANLLSCGRGLPGYTRCSL